MRDAELRELRARPLEAFTLRADTAEPRFGGRAIVYNIRTAIGNPLTWGFYEEIAPGASTKTLGEADVRFLVDHQTAMPVARTSAGTLTLEESDAGVDVDAALNTRKSYVADLVENLRDGTITGMSFGFRVVKDEWTTEEVETSDGHTAEVEVRTIRELQLFEVSAVTFPAYEDTEAGLRSQIDALRAKRAPETAARAGGDREPGEATRGIGDGQPADATGLVIAQHQLLRADALAARYRLPRP